MDTATDWIQAEALGGENIGLKQDGTLWRWGRWEILQTGTNGVGTVKKTSSEIPQSLLNPHDGEIREIRVTPYGSRLMARLSDDRVVWIHHRTSTDRDFRSLGDRGDSTVLDPIFDWRAVNPNWSLGIGLTSDGRIVERTDRPMPALPDSVDGQNDWVSLDLFWGEDDSYYLGLKRDGSLWRFNSADRPWYFESRHLRLPPRWRPKRIGHLMAEDSGAE